MKITNFFLKIFSFLGKKFSQNFHKILLDKIRKVCYNEIFGRGIRPRPTQKVKYFLKKFFGTPGGVVLVFSATKLLFTFTKLSSTGPGVPFHVKQKSPFGLSVMPL